MEHIDQIDKKAFLEKLDPVKYLKEEQRDKISVEQMDLSGALLTLAQINQESEYKLCHRIAEHLLDEIPEPDDKDLSDE
jgi:hypothetical protein